MKKQILTLLALGLAGLANAQTPDWSIPMSGKVKSIFFNDFTQTPIVECEDQYLGIDQSTKSVAWTINKSSLGAKALSVLTSSNSSVAKDYNEIYDTHIAACGAVVFDVATGEIILGNNENPFDQFVAGDAIAELNIALVKVRTDGFHYLYAIDIATNKVLWKTQLDKSTIASGIIKASVGKIYGRDFTRQLLDPIVNKGNIIYASGKVLYAIDGKTGTIKWQKEANPAFFSLSPNGKYIITAEPKGGLGAGLEGFSKKISCFDAATGENVWASVKLDGFFKGLSFVNDNEVVIADDYRVQKYEIATAKALWKKPHKGTNTSAAVVTKEGIKHYYGNKIQLLDVATGAELWKKEIKLVGLDDESLNAFQKDYENNFVIVTHNKVGVFKKADASKLYVISLDPEKDLVAFDDVRKKVIVTTGKKLIILDPEKDKKAPEVLKVKLNEPKELTGVYCSKNGEFIYGHGEYIFVGTDPNNIIAKVYPRLKTAFEKFAKYKKIENVSGFVPLSVGLPMTDLRVPVNVPFKINTKKRTAPRGDENIQVFVTGETSDAGDIIKLALVNKTTGKEIKQIEFSKNRGVIYEIDFNANVVYYYDNGNFNVMTLK